MNGSADAVSVSQKTLNVTVEEAGESLWGRLRANSRSHRTAPIHEGVLWKRRINKGRFEQVFVCLFQDRLIWYNVDDAAKRVRRELGGCLLLGALVSRKLTVHGRNNFRNGGYFALLDEDLHGAHYEFFCKNSVDATDEWTHAICTCIRAQNEQYDRCSSTCDVNVQNTLERMYDLCNILHNEAITSFDKCSSQTSPCGTPDDFTTIPAPFAPPLSPEWQTKLDDWRRSAHDNVRCNDNTHKLNNSVDVAPYDDVAVAAALKEIAELLTETLAGEKIVYKQTAVKFGLPQICIALSTSTARDVRQAALTTIQKLTVNSVAMSIECAGITPGVLVSFSAEHINPATYGPWWQLLFNLTKAPVVQEALLEHRIPQKFLAALRSLVKQLLDDTADSGHSPTALSSHTSYSLLAKFVYVCSGHESLRDALAQEDIVDVILDIATLSTKDAAAHSSSVAGHNCNVLGMLACYLEPTFDERVFKLFRHPCIDPTSGARYDSLFQWAVELMTMAIVGERQTIPSVQSIGRFLDFEGTAPPVVGMSAIDGFRVDLIHAGVLELCCSALSMETGDELSLVVRQLQALKIISQLCECDEGVTHASSLPSLKSTLELIVASDDGSEPRVVSLAQSVFIKLFAEKSVEQCKDMEQLHLMISYCWDDQVFVQWLTRNLRKSGVRVWVDTDNMSGSTLEAMAGAVEHAFCVLVVLSESYKNSNACRTEAEYAYQLKKPIIPVKSADYRPSGWLGALLGTRLWFSFSGLSRASKLEKIRLLLKEIAIKETEYCGVSASASGKDPKLASVVMAVSEFDDDADDGPESHSAIQARLDTLQRQNDDILSKLTALSSQLSTRGAADPFLQHMLGT
eukprot:m.1255378 g.1255378  ORF g.1255378 m.1255378 type:complete len:856 (+) comp24710_c1_seq7:270-2837(+)